MKNVLFAVLFVGIFVSSAVAQTIAIDIKPGSCPNPLNVKSKGVVSVAILGTVDFDVNDIDINMVGLLGVAPIRSSIEDVATPFEQTGAVACDACSEEGPDGIDDLVLKFSTQDIVAILEAQGMISDGNCVLIQLSATTIDGVSLIGQDVILIKNKGSKGRNK